MRTFPVFLVQLALATLLLPPSTHAAERAIDLHVVVPASVEKVWDAWTTTEGVKTFFAPDGKIEARVGGLYELYMNPLGEPGTKGSDDMHILALQDKKLLSFTWNAPPDYPEIRKQRTHVVVRFESISKDETLVTLHHDGWGDGGDWDKTFQYFVAAWPNVLANLKARFEKGPIDWSEWMAALRKYMEEEKAKSQKPSGK